MIYLRHVVFDCDGTLLDIRRGARPFEGIPELLYRLGQWDCEISVWTGRERASATRLLQQAGLWRLIQDVRTSSEVAAKPHPQGLLELLGHAPLATCAMVGDSWADMQAARQIGCPAIGALWDQAASRQELAEFGAQALVSTPGECYDALLLLLQG